MIEFIKTVASPDKNITNIQEKGRVLRTFETLKLLYKAGVINPGTKEALQDDGVKRVARPHPGPLPLGEGAPNFECAFAPLNRRVPLTRPPTTLSPSDGEREGVRGSWTAFIFLKRIGTMNQIGTPLPALSPQGGERVAEGRVRGVHGQGEPFGRAWVMQTFRVVQPALFRLSTRSAEGGGRSLLRFSDAGGASP